MESEGDATMHIGTWMSPESPWSPALSLASCYVGFSCLQGVWAGTWSPRELLEGGLFYFFLIKKKRFPLFKNYVERLLFNSLLLKSLMPIEGN